MLTDKRLSQRVTCFPSHANCEVCKSIRSEKGLQLFINQWESSLWSYYILRAKLRNALLIWKLTLPQALNAQETSSQLSEFIFIFKLPLNLISLPNKWIVVLIMAERISSVLSGPCLLGLFFQEWRLLSLDSFQKKNWTQCRKHNKNKQSKETIQKECWITIAVKHLGFSFFMADHFQNLQADVLA